MSDVKTKYARMVPCGGTEGEAFLWPEGSDGMPLREVRVGRALDNDWVVRGDAKCSRYQARFMLVAGTLSVVPEGRGGCFVNDKKVLECGVSLSHGDSVVLGRSKWRVECSGSALSQEDPASSALASSALSSRDDQDLGEPSLLKESSAIRKVFGKVFTKHGSKKNHPPNKVTDKVPNTVHPNTQNSSQASAGSMGVEFEQVATKSDPAERAAPKEAPEEAPKEFDTSGVDQRAEPKGFELAMQSSVSESLVMPVSGHKEEHQGEHRREYRIKNKPPNKGGRFVFVALVLGVLGFGVWVVWQGGAIKKSGTKKRASASAAAPGAGKVVDRAPQSASSAQSKALLIKGRREMGQGNYALALKSFNECLRHEPGHVLCSTYVQRAERKRAEKVREQMLRAKTLKAQHQFRACAVVGANVLSLLSRTKDAKLYSEALKLKLECENKK